MFLLSSKLIGIVESCELRSNLFKFVMRNNGDAKVQFLIWGEPLISKFKSKIMVNNVSIKNKYCTIMLNIDHRCYKYFFLFLGIVYQWSLCEREICCIQ